VAALVASLTLAVFAASAADAATCLALTRWTSTSHPASASFTTSPNSDCTDVYAAYTYDNNDYVRGLYKDGGSWVVGQRGWQLVTTSNDGWDTLLTSVLNGTEVKGQGFNYSQYVRYVM
jgi:hypothetical protein